MTSMLDETIRGMLRRRVEEHPYPLIFATVSGAHLYGFPSPNSDFDLRGAHLLPLKEAVGLKRGPETIEKEGIVEGVELDLVTHEVEKFFRLVARPNGYVLEQIFSPLVVQTSNVHEELMAIAKDCVTKHHAHHYIGFAHNQWKLFRKENPPRIKPLLYVYRVLLTGIYLMTSGVVEANLVRLNEEQKLPYLADLIERKTTLAENTTLTEADLTFHESEFERLLRKLEESGGSTGLADRPAGSERLNDLLVRLRVGDLLLERRFPSE